MKKFGSFEMDERARELRKGGIRVRLQDQPFEILALMLERPGDIVTRDELRQRLWPASKRCKRSLILFHRWCQGLFRWPWVRLPLSSLLVQIRVVPDQPIHLPYFFYSLSFSCS